MSVSERIALNKELCGLLGIPWHEVVDEDADLMYCSCGEMGGDINGFEVHCNRLNPDFTTEAGRVQLSKIMWKRKDFDKFLREQINGSYWLELEEYIERYVNDDNGAFAIAARDYLKQQKGGINEKS